MPEGTLAIRLHEGVLRLFPWSGRRARLQVRLEFFKTDTDCDETLKA